MERATLEELLWNHEDPCSQSVEEREWRVWSSYELVSFSTSSTQLHPVIFHFLFILSSPNKGQSSSHHPLSSSSLSSLNESLCYHCPCKVSAFIFSLFFSSSHLLYPKEDISFFVFTPEMWLCFCSQGRRAPKVHILRLRKCFFAWQHESRQFGYWLQ